MSAYTQLKKKFARLLQLQYLQRILNWDEAVMMPTGAGLARGKAMASLSRVMQKMLTTTKIKSLLNAAKAESLNDWDQTNLAWMEKRYLNATVIPTALVEAATKANLASEQAWRQLRSQNNWQAYYPYLQRAFDYAKEIAERRSQIFNLTPYETQLDLYAPGFSQHQVDQLFAALKDELPALIKTIVAKQANLSISRAQGPFAVDKQKQVGLTVMRALGFDFDCGRLDVSHHPFCSGGSTDVRITTRYEQDDFLSALLGICHETGHALYEQGLPQQWIDQPVGRVDSMAMHESQSLLIEMQVCRSAAFFEYLAPLMSQQFGVQSGLQAAQLYQQAIAVKSGLIRVDADEATYPLHVILRYELEQALFKGEIKIVDLPTCWNERMQQYLGLSTLGNDKDGVMQDVHWPAGVYGYFPAYTLGRLIAAQLFATYTAAYPNWQKSVSTGDFTSLHQWLHVNVYKYASRYKVDDFLNKVTGEPLDKRYFLNHLKARYLQP